jgi:hypothetical protein
MEQSSTSRLTHRVFGIFALLSMLAGCGTPQAYNAIPNAAGSSTVPEARGQDLIYLAGSNAVSVYTYPEGKLLGALKGLSKPGSDCVDKAQNVWIPDPSDGSVVEYAHGGTHPVQTLKLSFGVACAVDPVTGDLAVTAMFDGAVFVFKGARGKPTGYDTPSITRFNYCAYDDKGNLFADGGNGGKGYAFTLAELPKGAKKLKVVTLNQFITQPGGVAWDGKHLAIGDAAKPVIYQFTVSGTHGTRVGTTSLGSPAKYGSQFFVAGSRLIAPNVYPSKNQLLSDVLFYKYPAGGKPSQKIPAGHSNPRGLTLSLAQTP